jgi:hypothetical protein
MAQLSEFGITQKLFISVLIDVLFVANPKYSGVISNGHIEI